MSELNVWECRIIVDGPLPRGGFDSVPRDAAQAAIESYGIHIHELASGWGGTPTVEERIEFLGTQEDTPPPMSDDDLILMENLKRD